MEFQKHKLPSGLRVLLAPIENSETATVLFLIGTGSKYENKKNNGVSHFLEHLFFKGTKKRPRSKDITAEIDAVGGEINAFTSEEVTGYYTKVGHQSLPLALDLVSDIACNALFPAPEIEKERGVILEEINMYEDIPQQKVWIIWDDLLYGDQPAGWSVLGPKEVIKKISREEKFTLLLRGLDEFEQQVLQEVRRQEGITQNTLRLRVNMSKAKLSQVLTNLEKKKLVKREAQKKTLAVYSTLPF